MNEEYSIGCVGILKTWLIRAYRNALVEEAKTLTSKHLQRSEYSTARRQQLREEAEAGERHFQEGWSTLMDTNDPSSDKTHAVRKSRVGKRTPKRDPVGVRSDAS